MKIGAIEVGLEKDPVIIAEMSGNHNQSLKRALKIVDVASASGAQILKLQTYTADTITLDVERDEFMISNPNSLWAGRSMYSIYKEAHTPWEWQKEIFKYSEEKGMTCFSAVFDESSVDFLESINICAYKIASPEIVHLPLIRTVALTGKPTIISTGMATIAEIEFAVNEFRKFSSAEIALLKCTSSYPASPEDSNVLCIPYLRDLFGCEVGISDHTLGIGSAIAAVAHGATIIEKHLTLSRKDGGIDSAFSMEPAEMEKMVDETKKARLALGKVAFGPTESEYDSMTVRRSIYISENMKKGDLLTTKNTRIVRPNLGLSPSLYTNILGRRISKTIKKGTPLSWDLIN